MNPRRYPLAVLHNRRFTCGDQYELGRDVVDSLTGLRSRTAALRAAVDTDCLLAQVAAASQCNAAVIVGRNRLNGTGLGGLDALIDKLSDAGVLRFHRGQHLPYGILTSIGMGQAFPEGVIPAWVKQTTRQMHPSVRYINQQIARMDIHYPGPTWWAAESWESCFHHLQGIACRDLTRVFAREGRSLQGGRMYGGFWINMKREERKRILLNGQPVVEVDMTAAALRITYALRRVPWTWRADECPYKAGTGPRKAWKQLCNAMLASPRMLKQWPADMLPQAESPNESLLEFGWTLQAAMRELMLKHPGMSKAWFTGLSLRTQRVESDIVVAALKSLYRQVIPALPVHDAIYTTAEHTELVRKLIQIPQHI